MPVPILARVLVGFAKFVHLVHVVSQGALQISNIPYTHALLPLCRAFLTLMCHWCFDVEPVSVFGVAWFLICREEEVMFIMHECCVFGPSIGHFVSDMVCMCFDFQEGYPSTGVLFEGFHDEVKCWLVCMVLHLHGVEEAFPDLVE